jgi:hypothetical protein
MKILYVAGAFTAPTSWGIEQNVRAAERVGIYVARLGVMPLIPHANTRHFHGECTDEFWYAGTLELLKRCDGIIMCEGWSDSKGARAEFEYAKQHGMAVFMHGVTPVQSIADWGCMPAVAPAGVSTVKAPPNICYGLVPGNPAKALCMRRAGHEGAHAATSVADHAVG